MSDKREDPIRRRAHEQWEKDGRPDGRHQEHWRQASQEMEGGNESPRQTDPASDQRIGTSGGLSSGLQPGGTIPGGGPGTGVGSIGTGGGSTTGEATGTLGRKKPG